MPVRKSSIADYITFKNNATILSISFKQHIINYIQAELINLTIRVYIQVTVVILFTGMKAI